MNKVNVLGTEYEILIKKYDEEDAFKHHGIRGFCDAYAKQIIICNPATFPEWEREDIKIVDAAQKETLRHEIIHAFLNESGLSGASCKYADGWATNEEMIDWFAIQGVKICAVWKEARAI